MQFSNLFDLHKDFKGIIMKFMKAKLAVEDSFKVHYVQLMKDKSYEKVFRCEKNFMALKVNNKKCNNA